MNREVDEVGINHDVIWRSKLHVVFKEETHSVLLHPLDLDFVKVRDLGLFLMSFGIFGVLLFLDVFGFITLLPIPPFVYFIISYLHEPWVLWTEHPLNLCKLPRLVSLTLYTHLA